jgi:outer membrane biosynthesis protein TonB
MRVSARAAEKNQIERFEPVLPEGIKPQKRKIKLTVIIDRDGSVAEVRPVTASAIADPVQDSAIRAVSRWKYKVFLKDDSPQVVETEVEIEFKGE